jgi:hypothetical protein
VIDNDGAKKIKVLVLDDDPTREEAYRQMEASGEIEVDFHCLKDQDTSKVIQGLSDIDTPDIVFVDHMLDKTSAVSVKFMRTGKCVTPILREKWPAPPIIGVTAAKKDCLDHDGNNFYEEVFDFQDINQLEAFVLPIVNGYRSLEDVSDVAKFVDHLNAPEGEAESILHSIPDELLTLEVASFKHAMYRWFRRSLHSHPGFLYNDQWAAMTMGINNINFNVYADEFETAKYTGIWADIYAPRWWKKKLYELAIAERASARESVQAAACKRFKISEDHYSCCYKCGKPWPEVLAFTDEGLFSALYPAHLECSMPHPKGYLSQFFEEPRMIIE